ncbi:septum formation protein Maf [Marinilabiliaceae bacterium JC017]|nr:septum formation protein Maf [Marinilabiliaceae bacterium JC017]
MKTLLKNIEQYSIVLASQSPRRQQLLNDLGIEFEVLVKPEIEESFPDSLPMTEIPIYLAKHKATAYQEELTHDNILVITADTIVCCDNKVLGKPADYNQAIEMLQNLSGKAHEVITGVAITTQQKQHTFYASTKVFFKDLTPQEIEYYVTNYKPYDKAGAYGIQEWIGLTAIEKIEGSYFNVMGLPVQKLYTELLNF